MKAVVCPVCYGNGLVANGFYNQVGGMWASTGTKPETCRSCGGQGWVEVHDECGIDAIDPIWALAGL